MVEVTGWEGGGGITADESLTYMSSLAHARAVTLGPPPPPPPPPPSPPPIEAMSRWLRGTLGARGPLRSRYPEQQTAHFIFIN